MPTIIDSLVVTLGLDPAGFKKGQKETTAAFGKTKNEATAAAKELEARGKQAATFFSKIRNEVLSLAAAYLSVKGAEALTKTIIAGDAAIGRLSQNIGMNIEQISAWEGVVERTGGSVEGFTGSVKAIASSLQEFKLTGTSGMIPYLNAAHVNLQKFFSDSTTMQERLLMLSDAFKGMEPAKAQRLGQSLGLDEGTINALLKGRSAVSDMLENQYKLGVATKESTEDAIALQNAWHDVEDAIAGAWRKLVVNFSPALINLLKNVSGYIQDISNFGGLTKPKTGPGTQRNEFGEDVTPGRKRETKDYEKFYGVPKFSTHGSPKSGRKSLSTADFFKGLEDRYGLPAGLLYAAWGAESSYGKNMLSPAGAKGHFGFMDKTAKAYGLDDPNDLNKSALAAAKLFRDLLKEFHGDLKKAIAAYNWGAGNVEKHGVDRLPLETQKEIQRIMAGIASHSTSEVNIAQITINTKSTDASGISRDIGGSLKNTLSVQGNTGLN